MSFSVHTLFSFWYAGHGSCVGYSSQSSFSFVSSIHIESKYYHISLFFPLGTLSHYNIDILQRYVSYVNICPREQPCDHPLQPTNQSVWASDSVSGHSPFHLASGALHTLTSSGVWGNQVDKASGLSGGGSRSSSRCTLEVSKISDDKTVEKISLHFQEIYQMLAFFPKFLPDFCRK